MLPFRLKNFISSCVHIFLEQEIYVPEIRYAK
jgi:hypothetical protein